MSGAENDQTAWAGSASPPVTRERLTAALAEVTGRVREPDIRAQLGALAALLTNLGRESTGDRGPLEMAIAAAMADGDEAALIDAMRRLAALDRAALAPVDWAAVTRGWRGRRGGRAERVAPRPGHRRPRDRL